MCGRHAQYLPPEAIVRLFRARNATPNHAASWNVAPTQDALVIRRHPDTGFPIGQNETLSRRSPRRGRAGERDGLIASGDRARPVPVVALATAGTVGNGRTVGPGDAPRAGGAVC